ncbi:MAG: hypothetical protein KA193_12825 [Bacteroidia bacterium]|uniref:hypothetical protein n=1 Tax=Candidatus Pollutiaquabacter sp. TaxID=3416354 RepID=UPI001B5AFCCB|nr:hypothetical protein [Bacteroidota bacterium]MBP7773397.1 hypothetical protein [Bacteroidia bacterium]
MIRRVLLLLSCCLCASFLSAQSPMLQPPAPSEGDRFIDRVFFGGNFGLQFGTQTIIEIAPIVGYRLTDRLAAGVGGKYIYYRYRSAPFEYSTNMYGGSVFARYNILENLFAYTEYEILNLDAPDPLNPYRLRRTNVTSVFVGGGYRQMLGNNSSLNLMLLYNLNESTNSPYQNPIIRIGFGFGI